MSGKAWVGFIRFFDRDYIDSAPSQLRNEYSTLVERVNKTREDSGFCAVADGDEITVASSDIWPQQKPRKMKLRYEWILFLWPEK